MIRCLLCAAGVCAVASSSLGAISISGNVPASTEQTGATFDATLDYQFTGGSSGLLTIDMTNTSPGGVGGFITGLVFNFGSADAAAAATLASVTNANFLNAPSQNAAPFGSPFDAGASLGANWLGGGSPNGGIPVGGMATFTFNVTASDASLLSDASFLDGPFAQNFLVRFRGLADGGSDKVPAIPAPGALALMSIGGLAAVRRRR